jgi:deoxyhypusine synthase
MAHKGVLITSTEDIKHLLQQMNKYVVTFQENAAYGGHIYKLIRYSRACVVYKKTTGSMIRGGMDEIITWKVELS